MTDRVATGWFALLALGVAAALVFGCETGATTRPAHVDYPSPRVVPSPGAATNGARPPTRRLDAAAGASAAAPFASSPSSTAPPPVVSGSSATVTATQPAAQRTPGLVYFFPGIEGGPWMLEWARRAARDAGCEAEFRTLDWQRLDVLGNLVELERNRARAAQVAAEIVAFRNASPTAPIDLVGYSGGGGLAVMIAEALPESLRIRNLVLVHAAISPTHDLAAALRRIDGLLVNFYSHGDWVILGLGTRAFGAIDREHTDSAGHVGFDLTRAVPDLALRERVRQVRWTPEMIRSGHWGGHATIITYGFNKTYVAPYLLP
ncbi:MAG: hypothetical protein AB7Q17_02895 [Phycisphaerae bacterium]